MLLQIKVKPNDFNPRACVRHDWPRSGGSFSLVYFNPRACVRHDVAGSFGCDSPINFNPRACVRHDGREEETGGTERISIHVPA